MDIAFNTATLASLLGLAATVGGVLVAVFNFWRRFTTLEKHDKRDHELLNQLVRGQFATLSGLKQLGCNGEVTKAYEALREQVIDK